MREEKVSFPLNHDENINKLNSSAIVKGILEKPTKLSKDQSKAVLSKSRFNRIIAGAGAGKTETLTRRIAYLILLNKVEPSEIVAFTFTEKAAQSMKSRIYQRVEELVGSTGTTKLGEMYIGTIHAYAKRVLDDYFRYGNYSILDGNKEIAFLMRQGWDLGVHRKGESYSSNCRSFLRTVNMTWDEMLDEDELKKRAPDFFRMLKSYERLLEENRQLTFGRMIYLAVKNLKESPGTLRHVKHLIVDEYQDINRAQQEFIELIGLDGDIFVVGDPRQSIYQWRGSDQRFFEDFTSRFSGTFTQNIRENRRSVKRIVQNANIFAESFVTLSLEAMEPTRSDEGFIGLSHMEAPEDEAQWIADQVERLVLAKGKARFSDIGILVRSVSSSAEPLIDEFKRRRIPYLVGGKVGLFKRDEAQSVGRIFAWFSEGGFWTPDPWKWQEKIEGDKLLTTGLKYWEYSYGKVLPTDAEEKIREIRAKIYSKKGYFNFSEIYHDVLNALGFSQLDYTDPFNAAVMANLGRFNQMLTDYETAYRIGGRTMRWKSDLRNLCWFMNTYASTAYEEQPSDDIRGVDAVQVMTIHQAKGLEWPIVFIFSLVRSRFPPRLTGREQFWWDVPRDMFNAERYEGGLEDERRLFYVAITRPRDVLILSYFEKIGRNVGRCIFLNDLDDVVTQLGDSSLPDVTINPSIMPEELQTFSAKELVDFNFCPHRYLLRDLWGYQPGLQPRLGYGNSLHHCLRVAGEMVKDKGFSPVSAVSTAVDEEFHMPFMGGSVLDDFKERARSILVEFSRKYGDEMSRIEEVEYRLEYQIMNATVMGKVDVVLRDGGAMEVWDYKTSDEVESLEETSLQLRLYTLGLRSLGRNVESGAVAYLETPEVEDVAMDTDLLDKAKDYADRTVERITSRDFAPCPGENCKLCDHGSVCRWRAS